MIEDSIIEVIVGGCHLGITLKGEVMIYVDVYLVVIYEVMVYTSSSYVRRSRVAFVPIFLVLNKF